MKRRCSLSRLSKSSSSLVASCLAPSSSRTRESAAVVAVPVWCNCRGITDPLPTTRQFARAAVLCPLPPPAVLPLAADSQGLCVGLEPRRRVHGPELEVSAGRHQGRQGRPRVGESSLSVFKGSQNRESFFGGLWAGCESVGQVARIEGWRGRELAVHF